MKFAHLHCHTEYSLLDGSNKIKAYVTRVKELGMDAAAITDHGVMYGVIDFYRACEKEGIKPILGMEAYVAPRSRFDRDGSQDREYAHLILLAKNETGYKNLMLLSSEAFLHGFYYKPRIDYDLLAEHAEGLVCLSACLAGDIPQLLLKNRYDDAKALAARLQSIFHGDFYIELQNQGIPEQQQVLPGLRRIAKELSIKTVATNDIHYVERGDAEAQDVLLCIQTQRFVDETNRMRMQTDEFFVKSEEEMRLALPDDADAIANTREIADKCNVQIAFGVRRMPSFSAPDGMDNEAYLRKLCNEGLARKYPNADDAIRARLDYELSVVSHMGFVDYFLIVWDFIHFAKSNGIMVGPGRGSGAGSLAVYCLDITDIDPIRYNLLFERFLNPERVSMPDIDVDFCYERRQEVIDYVGRKYGEGHVSQIITFGTMAARAVLRDVGRVLRIPYADVDRLSKLVPAELNMTLERALKLSPELKTLYDTDPTMQKVIDLSLKLEGLPRHSSTHAAGVVISGVPITEVVPLQMNDSVLTTQFPMTTLEELGLLKMDFLGLRTLTVLRDALAFIRETHDGNAPDLDHLPFTDPAVYRMIARAETDGVFQLESSGMRQFLLQLRPDCFEDLIAGISLFRPGPMEQIPRYIRGKHDPSSVKYAHPLLEPILSNTYGCMVYQEQVMEIVRSLAGYSYGRSDLVRRAMSKKKHDVMAKEREFFIHGTEGVDGAVKRGVPEAVADRIFDEMMDFASYAFNKSHAACYAVLAYRTAYLKLYYPVEFMTALINSYMGGSDTVAKYVYTARRLGLAVLPPDVNRSRSRFSVEQVGKNEDGSKQLAIRFGLAAVKSVGGGVMDALVRERTERGAFRNFFDFCERTDGLNKRMLEALICAGCFDSMGARRSQLLAVYEQAFDGAMQQKKVKNAGQMSLFDLGGGTMLDQVSIKLPDIPELRSAILLAREREAAGLYLSGHPLDNFSQALDRFPLTVADLEEADGVTGVSDSSGVEVGGMLSSCKQRPAKNGNGMVGYAELEGVTGRVECVLFPRTLQQCGNLFYDDSPVAVRGKLNIREERTNSLLIEDLRPLAALQQTVFLRFASLTPDEMRRAAAFLRQYPGATPVVLFDAAKRIQKGVPENLYIEATDKFLQAAEAEFGKDNVKLK
ncbi:DNA polymerase III subunit alpha [Porcincola intestinalis]|uniref:DNA polymerase III subunit alpha n=1 Tax=Porcincola intestinalis TaxID=2606632 RepID=UPI002A90B724|nr:DNA polymerase III subunit alpha [Porcincola intestinalis]MDY5578393.1 DNA polymerase III subunit alpha [Porcincola intestinalis]